MGKYLIKTHLSMLFRLVLVGLVILSISACGDSGASDSQVFGDSLEPQNWKLIEVNGVQIDEADTVYLESQVESANLNLETQACSGSIRVVLKEDGSVSMSSLANSGCHIEFPISVLRNREVIREALLSGSRFELSSDQTLRIRDADVELVFSVAN